MRFWLVGFAFLSSACATTSYMAKVNGDPITGADLKREFGLRHASMEKYLSEEDTVRGYVEIAIDHRLLEQEARRIGLQDDPSISDVLAEYRAQVLVKLLLRQEIDDKSVPSEAEILTAYEKTGESSKVRQVTVGTREEAEQVRTRLLAGERVEDLAEELSLSRTAKQGGLMVVRWGMGEAWEQNVLPLKAGEVSQPFSTNEGWVVVRVEATVTFDKAPLEKARPRIKANLQSRIRNQREVDFLAEMRTKHAAQTVACDLSMAALRKAATEPADAVCATWDGGKITLHDLASRLDLDALGKEPPDRYPESIKIALTDLLTQDYLLAEATARGLDADPDVVSDMRVKSSRLLYNLVVGRYVLANVNPTDEEAKRYLEAHSKEMVEPESRIIRQVAVRTQKDADEIRAKLDGGASLDEAIKQATVVTAANASVAVKKSDLPAAADPIFKASAKEIVGPMPVQGGYFFAQILDIVPERKFGSEEALQAARDRLKAENSQRAYDGWVAKLRASGDVEVNEAGIRAFLADNRPPPVVMESPPTPPESPPVGTKKVGAGAKPSDPPAAGVPASPKP